LSLTKRATASEFGILLRYLTLNDRIDPRWLSGIVLGYGLDNWGSRVRFPAGAGNFSLHHRVQNGSGAHPASYAMGSRGYFRGVKRPGREADHQPPSSTEVNKTWSYTSTSQYVFMAWCLIKHRDNFIFAAILRDFLVTQVQVKRFEFL
jgi:hypothetical protein